MLVASVTKRDRGFLDHIGAESFKGEAWTKSPWQQILRDSLFR